MNNIEGTIFEDYSSVVFDLDKTIWECFTPEGTSIGAYTMTAPFELKSGLLIKDINGNYCKLQEGVRTIIKSLDADDINLGVVSSGEKEHTPLQAQPSVMLLKKFDLYKYFNLYVVCKQGINKREYVRPFGKTLFIDDDNENLDEVKVNEKVDVLDRKVFEDWDHLFQKKVSSLLFGLSSFLIKRAKEDFQLASGVDILMSVYKAEANYTLTKRRLEEGDDVTDEENVRYLQTKQSLTGIFENVITYLRSMLTDTIEYSKKMPAADLVSDKEEYRRHHEEVVPRFENALGYLNEASKYIYNEGQWPQVFIAIDNVVNLMHGDIAYISHMMMADEVSLQDSYEEYAKVNEVPGFEAEDNVSYYTGVLEDKWDEFIEFLTLQGKSLQFNTEASQKLSWEEQPELGVGDKIKMIKQLWTLDDINYVGLEGVIDRIEEAGIIVVFQAVNGEWARTIPLDDWENYMVITEQASQKLSWQQQPEEKYLYWLNRDDMEDIFVMARDYPGNLPSITNSTFAQQLRHDEGYAYNDFDYDNIIIKDYTRESQRASVLEYWQKAADKVGMNLRFEKVFKIEGSF